MNGLFDADEIITRVKKQIHDDGCIVCPYCGYEWEWHCDGDATTILPISYWGDGDYKLIDCHECGKDFLVKECVKRTYEIQGVE